MRDLEQDYVESDLQALGMLIISMVPHIKAKTTTLNNQELNHKPPAAAYYSSRKGTIIFVLARGNLVSPS